MHVVQSYHRSEIPQYVKALLQSQAKATCTNLSKVMNKSHDVMYRSIVKGHEEVSKTLSNLIKLVRENMNGRKKYLIMDDTQITKLYAKQIVGLEVGFDGSTGYCMQGIKMVTSVMSDGEVNIPINAKPYFSKNLAQEYYKSKTEIGIEIIKETQEEIEVERVLADAHYATRKMFNVLNEERISFLMKMPRSRIVTINGKKGQLQEVFRLKKNNRAESAKGVVNGTEYYFYAIRSPNKRVFYLISNDKMDRYDAARVYGIRWKIEEFHRTSKQELGLSDYQMRSLKKQRQHVLFVMHAYALACIRKPLMNFDCVEDAIRSFRIHEQDTSNYSFVYPENSLYYIM